MFGESLRFTVTSDWKPLWSNKREQTATESTLRKICLIMVCALGLQIRIRKTRELELDPRFLKYAVRCALKMKGLSKQVSVEKAA